MEGTVLFREFEERDIDFVYRCKNDDKLNKMVVGQYHPFTYEEAEKWVHGCMGEHETYKFWAVCTNDNEKRIVGWVSLSKIDLLNRSVCHNGLMIADNSYRGGTVKFEVMLYSMDYAFSVLKVHRLYGSCLSEHPVSPYMLTVLGFAFEGTHRDSVFKNGRFYDINDFSILESEYFEKKSNNRYEVGSLLQDYLNIKRHK